VGGDAYEDGIGPGHADPPAAMPSTNDQAHAADALAASSVKDGRRRAFILAAQELLSHEAVGLLGEDRCLAVGRDLERVVGGAVGGDAYEDGIALVA
jgi:hypothetical protein